MSATRLTHRGLPAWSISQPWAWLIVHGGKAGFKDVENRSWRSTFRGRFLVHAPAKMTLEMHHRACLFVQREFGVAAASEIPFLGDPRLHLGGIIGAATLTGQVIPPGEQSRARRWHIPEFWGHVIAEPIALPFYRCKGLQRNLFGRFDVEGGVVHEAAK
jgi:hypothetical protein